MEKLSGYCSEFLVHGVDVEGKKQGVDKRLIELLGKYVNIPATYAGGIKEMEDLFIIHNYGKNKLDFTIGSGLDIFGGTIKYKNIAKRFKN